MLLPILKYPHPLLMEKAKEVTLDSPISTFVNLLRYAMDHTGALGIAAPQLGISQRIIIVRLTNLKDPTYQTMINPKIIYWSGKMFDSEEACLSVDGNFIVKRDLEIKVEFGEYNSLLRVVSSFKNLEAIVIQHEIDHLDGILINTKGKRLNS